MSEPQIPKLAKQPQSDLTTMLRAWRDGSGTAFGSLLDQVYDALKVIAAKRLNQSDSAATMSPTELLHEALIGIMPNNTMHFVLLVWSIYWHSGWTPTVIAAKA